MMSKDLLLKGISYYGLREISGPGSNNKILGWIREVLPWVNDDSKAAWCGIFMGQLFDELGIRKPDKHAAAINWLKVGERILEKDVKPGDIVVFWRVSPSDWRSHVGIFIGYSENGNFLVLGGNQSNQVNIKEYTKSRLRGIRRI